MCHCDARDTQKGDTHERTWMTMSVRDGCMACARIYLFPFASAAPTPAA